MLKYYRRLIPLNIFIESSLSSMKSVKAALLSLVTALKFEHNSDLVSPTIGTANIIFCWFMIALTAAVFFRTLTTECFQLTAAKFRFSYCFCCDENSMRVKSSNRFLETLLVRINRLKFPFSSIFHISKP